MGVFLQDLGLDSINSPYQSFTLDLFESEVDISKASAIKNIIGGIFYIYIHDSSRFILLTDTGETVQKWTRVFSTRC